MTADQHGELVGPVQQVERGEIVAPAGVVAPPLARAEQDAGIGARGRLARLHVKAIGMHCDLAADGDAALVGAQIVFVGFEAERFGELQQLRAGMAVKAALGLGIVGDAFLEIEAGGCIGHESGLRRAGEGPLPEPPGPGASPERSLRSRLALTGFVLSLLAPEDREAAAAQDRAAPFGRTPSGTSPVRKAGMSSLSPSSPVSTGSGSSAASLPGSSAAISPAGSASIAASA